MALEQAPEWHVSIQAKLESQDFDTALVMLEVLAFRAALDQIPGLSEASVALNWEDNASPIIFSLLGEEGQFSEVKGAKPQLRRLKSAVTEQLSGTLSFSEAHDKLTRLKKRIHQILEQLG